MKSRLPLVISQSSNVRTITSLIGKAVTVHACTVLGLGLSLAGPAGLLAQANTDAQPHRIVQPFVFPDSCIRDLKSTDPRARAQAAMLLGNRSSRDSSAEDKDKAKKAFPDLILALKDPSADVREAAAFALGNVQGDPDVAVPALVAATEDKNDSVREHAATSLGRVGQRPDLAVPALIKLWQRDKFHQETYKDALVKFGAAAQPAVPTLVNMLKDPEAEYSAVVVLAAIGPGAGPAEPALLSMVKKARDSDKQGDIEEGLEAANALGKIGRDQAEAAAVTTSLLETEDKHDRARAAGVLGELGVAAVPSIPALVHALSDEDRDVPWIAGVALASIAKACRENHRTDAIEALQKAAAAMTANGDRRVKAQARFCLDAVAALEVDRQRGVKP